MATTDRTPRRTPRRASASRHAGTQARSGGIAARRREEARRPAFVRARAEDAAATAAIAEVGFLGVIRAAVANGGALPYPFSDPTRIAAIADDGSAPREWREAARFLLGTSVAD